MKMPCRLLRLSGLGNGDEEKKNNGTHGYFAFDKTKVGQMRALSMGMAAKRRKWQPKRTKLKLKCKVVERFNLSRRPLTQYQKIFLQRDFNIFILALNSH